MIRRTPQATDWSRGAFRHEWRRRIYISFILVGTSCTRAVSEDRPSVQALVRTQVSITLDGKLDEPVWREAPAIHLVQQSPKPGAATPYETEVRRDCNG